jgi:hypothetical protein
MGSKADLEKAQVVPSKSVLQPARMDGIDKTLKMESTGGKAQPRGVPTLNLSTLKHVREYTHQQTTLLDGKTKENEKQSQAS